MKNKQTKKNFSHPNVELFGEHYMSSFTTREQNKINKHLNKLAELHIEIEKKEFIPKHMYHVYTLYLAIDYLEDYINDYVAICVERLEKKMATKFVS